MRTLPALVLLAACARSTPPQATPDVDGRALAGCLALPVTLTAGTLALGIAGDAPVVRACLDPRPCLRAHGAPSVEALADGSPLRATLDAALDADELVATLPLADDCAAAWTASLAPAVADFGADLIAALGVDGGAEVCVTWARPDLSACAR